MITQGLAQEHVVVWRRESPDIFTNAPGLIRLPGGGLLVAFVELSISGGQALYLKSDRDAIAEAGVKDQRFGIRVVEQVEQLVVQIAIVDVDGHAPALEGGELRL